VRHASRVTSTKHSFRTIVLKRDSGRSLDGWATLLISYKCWFCGKLDKSCWSS